MVAALPKTALDIPGRIGGGDDRFGDSGGPSPGTGGFPDSPFFSTKQIGLWIALSTITMLFAGVSSALIVRRSSPDWKFLFFPRVLWINTALLLASSFTFELSRKFLRAKNFSGYRGWLTLTLGLGMAFLLGQVRAWRVLRAHGVFLPTNPHASFFYLITGLHALHLVVGILWMTAAFLRSGRVKNRVTEDLSLSLLGTYWHYLDALWVYLLVILFIW